MHIISPQIQQPRKQTGVIPLGVLAFAAKHKTSPPMPASQQARALSLVGSSLLVAALKKHRLLHNILAASKLNYTPCGTTAAVPAYVKKKRNNSTRDFAHPAKQTTSDYSSSTCVRKENANSVRHFAHPTRQTTYIRLTQTERHHKYHKTTVN